jgi:hypothetical protein
MLRINVSVPFTREENQALKNQEDSPLQKANACYSAFSSSFE